jgi:uncharacterized secreted protein with C-terminal beta-propeller domain
MRLLSDKARVAAATLTADCYFALDWPNSCDYNSDLGDSRSGHANRTPSSAITSNDPLQESDMSSKNLAARNGIRKGTPRRSALGTIEQLECRCLLNARRIWTITGDHNPQDPTDQIVIDRDIDQPGMLRAIVNGEIVGTRRDRRVSGIRISSGDGSDTVTVDESHGSIFVPITVSAGSGDDEVTTGSGRDSIDGGAGQDSLSGGAGNDRLRGGDDANRLEGGAGADDLRGGSDDDTIWGGDGDDRVLGLAGRDRLQGGDGNDTLLGGFGDDTLVGHGDDPAGESSQAIGARTSGSNAPEDGDKLDGGAGNNVLVGQADEDVLQNGRPPETLEHLGSCTDVAERLIEQAQKQYSWYTGGGWGRPGGGVFLPLDTARVETFASALSGSGAAGSNTTPSGSPTHSDTNTQELGVDEADIVKTDGNSIFVLRDGELIIVDALPAEDAAVLSRTDVEGYAIDMFLRGDRLMIFSTIFEFGTLPFGPGNAIRLAMPIYAGSPQVKITVFNVSNPAEPRLEHESFLDGSYVNARMVDGQVYMVLNNSPRFPIPWIRAFDAGTEVESPEHFQSRLAEVDPDSLLPQFHSIDYSDSGMTEQTGDLIVDCDGVYKTPTDDWMNLTTVLAFDLDADTIGAPRDSATVFGNISTVYASNQNLYLINQNWHADAVVSGIHRIALGDDIRVTASGEVPGNVLNQFSLDEEGAYFRIATTTNTWDPATGRNHSSSSVFVLAEDEGTLNVVGSIDEIAPGEQLYAARFFDDHGFVVTFRQVDPLFALDLSDPTDPKVAGELEVSGFSRYLHPVDENHLLAIGRDADANGRVRGLQVSLFDVSDLSNPTLVEQYLIQPEGGWNWSPAEWDYHAFSYFPESGVLAVPVDGSVRIEPVDDGDPTTADLVQWRYESDVWVFHVDVDNGFDLLGQVQHDSTALRSLRIDDALYTLARDDIKIQPLLHPTATIQQVSLE